MTSYGATQATAAPEWAQRLAEHLGVSSVDQARKLSGGASRETWSFTVPADDGTVRPLVIQIVRRNADHDLDREVRVLRAAARAGVPVAEIVTSSSGSDVVGAPFVVSQFVEGETLGHRIVRDPPYADARTKLAFQLGACLAQIHSIDDPVREELAEVPDILRVVREEVDALAAANPVAELVLSWLDANRPPPVSRQRVVHGDFRIGNLLIDEHGLQLVLDWELTHLGDPVEDLGWLCVRAWRYGGRGRVGGVGDVSDLLAGYRTAGGEEVPPSTVRWWETVGTLRWAVGCTAQANLHLHGVRRSHELAAIGRRACESEFDALQLVREAVVNGVS